MNKLDLVRLGEIYARHTGLKLSTISTYAANDGKWLGNLKGSSVASCTVRKANVVLSWFSNHWPADLDWPTDIPRPQKSKEVA